MPVESFRLHVPEGASFVFAATHRPERLEAIALVMEREGARLVGPGAWLLEGEGDAIAAVAKLFERLGKGECPYVLGPGVGGSSCGMIAEANTEGGVVVDG